MSAITFRTPYTKNPRVQYVEKSPGKTHQSFAEDCDINKIMAKYAKTGLLPELIKEDGQYGDFSDPVDYQEAQNLVIRAQAQFAALDANVRDKFKNEPAAFLEWAQNPQNAEEMATLGLMKKDAVERVQNAKKSNSTKAPEPKKEGEAK